MTAGEVVATGRHARRPVQAVLKVLLHGKCVCTKVACSVLGRTAQLLSSGSSGSRRLIMRTMSDLAPPGAGPCSRQSKIYGVTPLTGSQTFQANGNFHSSSASAGPLNAAIIYRHRKNDAVVVRVLSAITLRAL